MTKANFQALATACEIYGNGDDDIAPIAIKKAR
jgi:hypothetical protein